MRTQLQLVIVGLFVAGNAFSQVNLDQPLSVGSSDKVFRSAADPNVAYYFPIALHRVSDVVITEQDDRLNARFSVGIDSGAMDLAAKTLASQGLGTTQLHVLRPLQAQLSLGTDIPEKFDPVLTPLGEIDLLGPTPFSLNVGLFWRLIGRNLGEALFDQLFGTSNQDNVGILRYEFNAVVGGKPYLGQTAVGVFVGKRGSISVVNASLQQLSDTAGDVILMDSSSQCWGSVGPGEICLR